MPPWGPAAGPPVGRDARVRDMRARVRVRAKVRAKVSARMWGDVLGDDSEIGSTVYIV